MPQSRAAIKIAVLTLALVSCVGGVGWLLVLAKTRADDSARTSGCHGCLTSIAIAMHEYHAKHGSFPPAYTADALGRPVHSWRVLLLEFIDPDLYDEYRFDEPWNGPHNHLLESRMPSCYRCPACRQDQGRWFTNYFVVVGDRTLFPELRTIALSELEKPQSMVVLVVESTSQEVHWMEPKDLSFSSMSFTVNDPSKPSVSAKHRAGPSVCTVDGTKRHADNLSEAALREMLLIRQSPDTCCALSK